MRVQVVELTLSDGRKVSAVFPAFAESDSNLAVRSIQVWEPIDDERFVIEQPFKPEGE